MSVYKTKLEDYFLILSDEEEVAEGDYIFYNNALYKADKDVLQNSLKIVAYSGLNHKVKKLEGVFEYPYMGNQWDIFNADEMYDNEGREILPLPVEKRYKKDVK